MNCRPFLMEQNEDATKVYLATMNQVVTAGMGTIVDIDFNAIKFVMELYDIQDKKTCFEKVVGMFRHFLEESKGD